MKLKYLNILLIALMSQHSNGAPTDIKPIRALHALSSYDRYWLGRQVSDEISLSDRYHRDSPNVGSSSSSTSSDTDDDTAFSPGPGFQLDNVRDYILPKYLGNNQHLFYPALFPPSGTQSASWLYLEWRPLETMHAVIRACPSARDRHDQLKIQAYIKILNNADQEVLKQKFKFSLFQGITGVPIQIPADSRLMVRLYFKDPEGRQQFNIGNYEFDFAESNRE
jgi:hypothetical protein